MMRKNNPVFIISIISIVVIFLVTFFLSNQQIINKTITISLFLAEILALINYFVGIFSVKFSFNKNNNIFLLSILGGMFLRMFFTLILIGVIIKLLKVNVFCFILVFFILYFYFLTLEIIYLLKLYSRISPKRE